MIVVALLDIFWVRVLIVGHVVFRGAPFTADYRYHPRHASQRETVAEVRWDLKVSAQEFIKFWAIMNLRSCIRVSDDLDDPISVPIKEAQC